MNEKEWAEKLTNPELAAVFESMVPTAPTMTQRELYREAAIRLREQTQQ